MATPEVDENSHHVKNNSHRCIIKPKKFHFDILWCYRVIKESFPEGQNPPPPPSPDELTLPRLGDITHSQPGWQNPPPL